MASVFLNPKFNFSSTDTTSFISSALFFCKSSKIQPLPQQWRLSMSIKCSLSRPQYIPNRIPDPSYIRVLDTTLRDGEQAPGAAMNIKEKLEVARELAKLGVDIIEAGFPASSKDNFEAVKMIAMEVGNTVDEYGHFPVIAAIARCNRSDIDAAWEAVKLAKRPRICTFIETSDIHLKYKLRMSREEVVSISREMVSYARSLGCDDVQFVPEDAGRSDREFLYEVIGEVIKAGAATINITDTVGYNFPSEFGQLIADIKSNAPGIDNAIIAIQCHNDLGLSTANTIAGAYAGARQIDVTINGIGERAGNASLEEVIMAIKCRGRELLGGLYTGINTNHIVSASKMVAEYSGLHVQPHKAIVGANAYAHTSSIHQSFSDGDIEPLISDENFQPRFIWSLGDLQVSCGTTSLSTATVKLVGADEKEHVACSVGKGSIDAAYKAIDLIVKVPVTLVEYTVNTVAGGIDAIAFTRVKIREENIRTSTLTLTGENVHPTFSGTGAGTDITVSSVQAYVSALNKMLSFKNVSASKVFPEIAPVSS